MSTRLEVPIDSIKIPPDRFRPAKPKDVEETAISLLRYGQLQPIIINSNHELVDGLHRITAARENGQTTIWVDIRDQIDEVLHREIELETNIRRVDMTPFERVQAIAEIDKLKRSRDPNWTIGNTAQAIKSERKNDVSDATKIVAMAELFPELKETLKGAKSVRQLKSWVEHKAANVTRILDVKDNRIDYADIESKVWLGDSVDLIKRVPSESINAVITDPPFGLDYDQRKGGTSGELTAYEDSETAYRRLLTMAPDLYRVLKPNGWLVWFFGISWYEECKRAFREAGFTVDEIPVVWDRSDGKCHTNRPDRYFARGYDVALHAFKGDPQVILRGRPNVIREKPVDNSDREALVERPIGLYAELIRRLTVPGETVADFFVGSGSCLAAAASLRRDYFGCELSPERRAIAIKKIRANTPDEE